MDQMPNNHQSTSVETTPSIEERLKGNCRAAFGSYHGGRAGFGEV